MARRRVEQMAAVLVMTAMAAVSGGCLAVAGAAAAGAGVAYSQQMAHGTVQAEPDQVLDAAREVIDDWGMLLSDEELDRAQPRLTAHTAAGRRVRIIVEPQVANRTTLRVRYGTFGDRAQSSELYIQIAQRAEEMAGR